MPTRIAAHVVSIGMSCIQIPDQYSISIVPMQSIENINGEFFRRRRIYNSHCIFVIGFEYIGRNVIMDVIEFGSDSVRNFSSDSQTNTTEIIQTVFIVNSVPSLEIRSKLIVDLIVEVQPSECPDAWTGLRNINDKIFEMQSQTADVVEQQ